jgi:hypothetical protein
VAGSICILFHFSQASPVLIDRFASTFVQLIFNKLQPGILRERSIATEIRTAAAALIVHTQAVEVCEEEVEDVADTSSTSSSHTSTACVWTMRAAAAVLISVAMDLSTPPDHFSGDMRATCDKAGQVCSC